MHHPFPSYSSMRSAFTRILQPSQQRFSPSLLWKSSRRHACSLRSLSHHTPAPTWRWNWPWCDHFGCRNTQCFPRRHSPGPQATSALLSPLSYISTALKRARVLFGSSKSIICPVIHSLAPVAPDPSPHVSFCSNIPHCHCLGHWTPFTGPKPIILNVNARWDWLSLLVLGAIKGRWCDALGPLKTVCTILPELHGPMGIKADVGASCSSSWIRGVGWWVRKVRNPTLDILSQ